MARVPYQGMRPRSSLISIDPMAATQPPTAGPPSAIAAMIGAIDTAWCEPIGSRTGRADAIRVRIVQKPTPSAISNPDADGPAGSSLRVMRWVGGKHKSRSHKRERAHGHDSGDVELRDLGIDLPCSLCHRPRTLSPLVLRRLWHNVLENPLMKLHLRPRSWRCSTASPEFAAVWPSWCVLPALVDISVWTRCASFSGPRAPKNTKTDLTLWVGRLHYSLRSTLSAHFRWCFCASECLYIAS